MKYAFIIGTSVFISEQPTVSYADADQRIEFLKVLSPYSHHDSRADHLLAVDANVNSTDDEVIGITNNQPQVGTNIMIKSDDKRIGFYRDANHHPILEVHQLDESDVAGLSSHIVNEIAAQQPGAVFHIKGDFRVGGHRILIENEKYFVDGDDYANGVTSSHQGVVLVPYGVLI
ncbi:hypothetical protein KHS38_09425 [Mucilaginibacter sp. Bleaf8]|uniref:hypothetical protein n=1 Tax=Mucilaginibacter sp. Bleaf8 TaxID=2834430 RepID=UPI001BD13CFC|nr:hypothetical protein [Mucilaginibacter sp. Bleaf8]MBS7564626.1 hypothetical protein [Mucilaginibacter sp. Bleaf8]